MILSTCQLVPKFALSTIVIVDASEARLRRCIATVTPEKPPPIIPTRILPTVYGDKSLSLTRRFTYFMCARSSTKFETWTSEIMRGYASTRLKFLNKALSMHYQIRATFRGMATRTNKPETLPVLSERVKIWNKTPAKPESKLASSHWVRSG